MCFLSFFLSIHTNHTYINFLTFHQPCLVHLVHLVNLNPIPPSAPSRIHMYWADFTHIGMECLRPGLRINPHSVESLRLTKCRRHARVIYTAVHVSYFSQHPYLHVSALRHMCGGGRQYLSQNFPRLLLRFQSAQCIVLLVFSKRRFPLTHERYKHSKSNSHPPILRLMRCVLPTKAVAN